MDSVDSVAYQPATTEEKNHTMHRPRRRGAACRRCVAILRENGATVVAWAGRIDADDGAFPWRRVRLECGRG